MFHLSIASFRCPPFQAAHERSGSNRGPMAFGPVAQTIASAPHSHKTLANCMNNHWVSLAFYLSFGHPRLGRMGHELQYIPETDLGSLANGPQRLGYHRRNLCPTHRTLTFGCPFLPILRVRPSGASFTLVPFLPHPFHVSLWTVEGPLEPLLKLPSKQGKVTRTGHPLHFGLIFSDKGLHVL